MPNPWLIHVTEHRKQNPNSTFKECLRDAAATYKRPKAEPREENGATE